MEGEVRSLVGEGGEKVGEAFGKSVVGLSALAHQPGAAVEVPADHEYGRTRLDESPAQRAVVAPGIDQHGRPFGSRETPDVALGTEDHVRLLADATP